MTIYNNLNEQHNDSDKKEKHSSYLNKWRNHGNSYPPIPKQEGRITRASLYVRKQGGETYRSQGEGIHKDYLEWPEVTPLLSTCGHRILNNERNSSLMWASVTSICMIKGNTRDKALVTCLAAQVDWASSRRSNIQERCEKCWVISNGGIERKIQDKGIWEDIMWRHQRRREARYEALTSKINELLTSILVL